MGVAIREQGDLGLWRTDAIGPKSTFMSKTRKFFKGSLYGYMGIWLYGYMVTRGVLGFRDDGYVSPDFWWLGSWRD